MSEDYQLAAKAGVKRRASSPHRESAREERSSVSSAAGSSDLYTRRSLQQLPSRNSPVPKHMPNHGSVSSASSYNPRNGSMASSYGLSVASSATSYTSGRLSPGALSPAIDPELGNLTYPIGRSLNPSPGPPTDTSAQQTPTHESVPVPAPQQLTVGEVQSRQNSISNGVSNGVPGGTSNSALNGVSNGIPNNVPNGISVVIPNAQGMLMCECCPKKPKKFNSQEELR